MAEIGLTSFDLSSQSVDYDLSAIFLFNATEDLRAKSFRVSFSQNNYSHIFSFTTQIFDRLYSQPFKAFFLLYILWRFQPLGPNLNLNLFSTPAIVTTIVTNLNVFMIKK